MEINITRATITETKTVALLNDHVHQKHVKAVPTLFKEKTLKESQEIFEQILALDNAYVFIAWHGKTAVGYTIAFIQYKEETPFTFPRHYIIIDQISVNPHWKGKGIGRALVNQVVDVATRHGIDEIDAATWSFNQEAMSFFEAFGFKNQLVRLSLDLRE